MAEQPIVWTDDPNRISGIFVKEHEGRITIVGIGERISFNCHDGENVKEVIKEIGRVLAGKPVGDTYKIISEHFGFEEAR